VLYRVKPRDCSTLVFAADVKLRADVILLAPPGADDSRPTDKSRRGELDDVASLAGSE